VTLDRHAEHRTPAGPHQASFLDTPLTQLERAQANVAWTPSLSTLQAADFSSRCPSSQVRLTSAGVR